MGEKKTLAKARMELEELYLGIPDESVNLTFQDFADVAQIQHHPLTSDRSSSWKNKNNNKKGTPTRPDPITEEQQLTHNNNNNSPAMAKIPSIDFSRGLHASPLHHHDHHGGHLHHHDVQSSSHHLHYSSDMRRAMSSMPAYDHDVSGMSMAATSAAVGSRRRPGIPHSNICTVCTNYIYLFRHRCLVCGRVYCRNCVCMGMGEMTEGRKCIDCLGRKFSSRYIHRAGETGCWSRCFGYRSEVKQAELKWAEKGPRRTGRGSMTMSRSVSPMSLRSPMGPRSPMGHSNPPSFVAATPSHGAYSPYSTSHHHHLPF